VQEEHIIGEVDVREEEINNRPKGGAIRVIRQFGCRQVKQEQRDTSKDRPRHDTRLLDIGLGRSGIRVCGRGDSSWGGVHYFHAGED
jgi:hypothetical protein